MQHNKQTGNWANMVAVYLLKVITAVYFCQAYATGTCIKSTEYTGTVSLTERGIKCQPWSAQSPHSHTSGNKDFEFPDETVSAAANHCRDPTNSGFTWCYTMNSSVRWQKCNVDLCASRTCRKSTEYTGKVSLTEKGIKCQPWTAQSPHSHTFGIKDFEFSDETVSAAANHCRDPNNSGFTWCYTMDPAIRWQKCNVDLCACNRTMHYKGNVSISATGKTCYPWNRHKELRFTLSDTDFIDGSVAAAKNYCRDPLKKEYLYCIIGEGKTEACSIDMCD